MNRNGGTDYQYAFDVPRRERSVGVYRGGALGLTHSETWGDESPQ